MALGSYLFGSPAKTQQLPLFSPPQQQARNSLLQMGQQQLQNNPLSFAPQREQYLKQFNEQIIPTLAERFADNQRSSAFKGALGNTASDFGAKLGALESQYNLQANQQGFNQLRSALTPDFQYYSTPAQSGLLQNLAGQLGQLGINYLSGGLGNLLNNQSFSGGMRNTDQFEQLQNIFNNLNIPASKIQQILEILGAA